MKSIDKFKALSFILVVTYLLSACTGGAAAPVISAGSDKPLARPVTFVGTVETIVGDQWTINGVTVTVGPDIVRDGPFKVGDSIKVEGQVDQNGIVTVSRVESASQDDLSTLPQLGNNNDADSTNINSNDDNSNDVNLNDDNSNASSSNDPNVNEDNGSNVNSNDDNGNDSSSNVNESGNGTNSNDDDHSGSNSNDDSHDDNGSDDHGSDDNNNNG